MYSRRFATQKLDELTERQHELQRLVAKAVESGEPVFMGVWGPTGHALYITAVAKSAPTGNGATDE